VQAPLAHSRGPTDGFGFDLLACDGKARAGVLHTPHGDVPTPIFMPVGTAGTVKAMTPSDLSAVDAHIVLGNTYHLLLRPGVEVVKALGGLHKVMAWPRPILTDSGGFQVFSLRDMARIDEDGVSFRSHIDGSSHRLSPEISMAVQGGLGSDIAMAFDQCPPGDASREVQEDAMARTTRWAARSLAAPRGQGQALFGIVQGGTELDLRRRHVDEICALPFDGFALGGLSVGETPAQMYVVLEAIAQLLPRDRPRYLMGVGTPEDLVVGIGAGIDMFDCVMPTRNARNGQLFTRRGRVAIGNAKHRLDASPVEDGCTCDTCQRFSRGTLRHLFLAREILYSRLATLHNLHYYLRLAREARAAVLEGRYPEFKRAFFADLGSPAAPAASD
jgi:queuine tRNA-ribosyltransferase